MGASPGRARLAAETALMAPIALRSMQGIWTRSPFAGKSCRGDARARSPRHSPLAPWCRRARRITRQPPSQSRLGSPWHDRVVLVSDDHLSAPNKHTSSRVARCDDHISFRCHGVPGHCCIATLAGGSGLFRVKLSRHDRASRAYPECPLTPRLLTLSLQQLSMTAM
jgi:hypothetical protein